jgi:anti-anti-sigma regulatory factor
MGQPENPTFLVDASCEPAAVKISGRACFQNSSCLREFFTEMIKDGRRRFMVDFGGCASMDSTFLGVLAGTALELRRLDPPGTVTLCNIGDRNLELVRNLGLHRIMTVDANGECPTGLQPEALHEEKKGEAENAKLVLKAHEDLVQAAPENQEKFQDVLDFLKDRVNGS